MPTTNRYPVVTTDATDKVLRMVGKLLPTSLVVQKWNITMPNFEDMVLQ